MKTTLYYFSGTGNSLTIARRLAEELRNTEVKNMAEELHRGSATDRLEENSGMNEGFAERIGFIFPTYAYGLPRMVREFTESFLPPQGSYLFAVTSCAGIPGTVLKQLNKLLRKKKVRLHAGFSVLDKSSSLINDPEKDGIQRLMISVNKGETPEPSSNRIPEIAAAVTECTDQPLETSNRKTNFIGSILYPLAMKSFPAQAENFHVDGVCSGCGICSQICPRKNITLVKGKPKWGEDCEMCHACIQWCPNSAVQYKNLTENRPRYRNSEVTVKDMILHDLP